MANTVVFLWISVAAGAHSPSARELLDLAELGALRNVSFVPAKAEQSARPAVPELEVDAIEAELEQARTALAALEEDAASERLSRVEVTLRSHPHLPQAAFLMAECFALQAQVAREQSPARAAALEAEREALEGPRAVAFGENATATTHPAPIELTLEGLAERDTLELDGALVPVGAQQVSLLPGLHQARVWRRGQLVLTSFSEVANDQRTFALAVPPLEPCSRDDLLGADSEAFASCRRWARVRSETGGIGLAWCEHARCGPFVHWQRPGAAPFAPIAVTAAPGDRRALAGWALAGVGLVAVSGLVLWQAGAFDRSHPSTTSWEFGGVQQGLRF